MIVNEVNLGNIIKTEQRSRKNSTIPLVVSVQHYFPFFFPFSYCSCLLSNLYSQMVIHKLNLSQKKEYCLCLLLFLLVY